MKLNQLTALTGVVAAMVLGLSTSSAIAAPQDVTVLAEQSPQASIYADVAAAPSATTTAAAAALTYCNTASGKYTAGTNVSVPSRNGNFNCWLERGNNNPGVTALQRSLKNCYGQNIVIDGNFGNQTYNALLAAQRNIGGVVIDGIYGPQTRNAMFHSTTGGECYYAGVSW